MTITGNVLRQLRTLKGLKQKAMAEKLGISQPAYSKLEKSKIISGEKLTKVLEALGYTKEELQQAVGLLFTKYK
jgi:transcriptional regulator with XRE-family HTH domain